MNLVESPQLAECGPISTARRWLEEHGRLVLATVVSTFGSAPVPVGGQLVVAHGDRFEGSVSGGCVEADVISEAADVLTKGQTRLLELGVADETARLAGLPCGGTIKVMFESFERDRDAAFLDRILLARRTRQPLAVVTDVGSGTRRLWQEW